MGFELSGDFGDRGEPQIKQGSVGGISIGRRRLVADGVQVLSRGALICPACSLPLSPAPKVAPRAELRCSFCDHAAAAIEFLASGRFDAPANEVALVARLV